MMKPVPPRNKSPLTQLTTSPRTCAAMITTASLHPQTRRRNHPIPAVVRAAPSSRKKIPTVLPRGASCLYAIGLRSQRRSLDYFQTLWNFPQPWIPPSGTNDRVPDLPQFPAGTQVALVRQMTLFDDRGNLVPAPITESVQIPVYRTITASKENRYESEDFEELSRRSGQSPGRRPFRTPGEKPHSAPTTHGTDFSPVCHLSFCGRNQLARKPRPVTQTESSSAGPFRESLWASLVGIRSNHQLEARPR